MTNPILKIVLATLAIASSAYAAQPKLFAPPRKRNQRVLLRAERGQTCLQAHRQGAREVLLHGEEVDPITARKIEVFTAGCQLCDDTRAGARVELHGAAIWMIGHDAAE